MNTEYFWWLVVLASIAGAGLLALLLVRTDTEGDDDGMVDGETNASGPVGTRPVARPPGDRPDIGGIRHAARPPVDRPGRR